MSDSDRRGFITILIGAFGGLIMFGDEILRVLRRGWWVAPATDDVAESVSEDDGTDGTQSIPTDEAQSVELPSENSDVLEGTEESSGRTPSEGSDVLEGTILPECTDAYIENFEWISGDDVFDVFRGTLVNQSDLAGTVEITLELYATELEQDLLESLVETVAIGAQEVKTVEMQTLPPPDADYAVMSVSRQDCK